MAKYAKDDCRYTKEINRPKQLFSKYPIAIKESIFIGDNRKERRGIMARFRKVYGKKAFLIARANAKGTKLIDLVVHWINQDTNKDRAYKALKFVRGY